MTDSQAVVVWGQVAARAAARGSDSDFAMCVTGVVSEQLAEVQLMPCHDVLASAAPVLAADLGDGKSVRRWPAFALAARQLLSCARIAALTCTTIPAVRSSRGAGPGWSELV